MSRLMPFASIGLKGVGNSRMRPRLFVDFPSRGSKADKRDYPATAAGARRAGKEIADAGFESFMCSSSLDFPDESGAPDLDFRELISEGATAKSKKEKEEVGKIVVKMFACCDEHLLSKLGRNQRKVYEDLKERSLNDNV